MKRKIKPTAINLYGKKLAMRGKKIKMIPTVSLLKQKKADADE